jgi:hypothetical protein
MKNRTNTQSVVNHEIAENTSVLHSQIMPRLIDVLEASEVVEIAQATF